MKTFLMSRRALMRGVSVLAIGPALASCGAGTNPIGQIPAWVAAFQAVATEVDSILPQLVGVGLTGSALAKAQGIVNEIKTALAAIGSASSDLQGRTTLSIVEGYINALAPLVLPFVSAVPGGSVIGLIVAALPAVEVAFNFFVSLLSPQASQVAASAPALPKALRRGTAGLPPAALYLELLEATAAQKRAARRHR